ncbi:MAG: EamA family transporter [Candidatus Omnitrophota bacterium]|nr:EamA family transporter [Candidatus Omnitrophota bacterium]MBU1928827.1 EamA family transporter [Candidatus Omnitrophota bacterium]MBU2034437.1 EamA family transporter [Candidatus Omnitrophota bacterium]
MDWKIFAFGSAFFAGITAILAKIGVRNIPSNLATFIRTVVIIIFLGVLIGLRREWKNPFLIDKHSLIFLVLSGIATGLSWICYFRALQAGPASLVAPIDKLSLVFAILLSLIFLGERLGMYQWIGVCLITVGVIIIIFK